MTRRLQTERDAAAHKPKADRYTVRDGKVAQLELVIQPSGTKAWSVRYRVAGQQRRLRLGEYPGIGLAAARVRARRELVKVGDGTDPQREREEARRAAVEADHARTAAAENTIDALCAVYLTDHAETKKRERPRRDDARMIRREIVPVWGGRPLSDIRQEDVADLHAAITARPAPIKANRVLALVSKLFRFAVAKRKIDASPVVGIARNPEAKARDAHVAPYAHDEIATIWTATDALDASERAQVRLALLTAARPGEVTGMRWTEIDGDWWTIPGTRSKNKKTHRLYLGPMAQSILAKIPRTTDAHVFKGTRGKRQRADVNAIAFAGVTPRPKPRHSLRATASVLMLESGVSHEDVSRVLNHSVGLTVTQGYIASYSFDREKQRALLKLERAVLARVAPAATARVVAIRRTAR